eukprot:EG_transcript_38722
MWGPAAAETAPAPVGAACAPDSEGYEVEELPTTCCIRGIRVKLQEDSGWPAKHLHVVADTVDIDAARLSHRGLDLHIVCRALHIRKEGVTVDLRGPDAEVDFPAGAQAPPGCYAQAGDDGGRGGEFLVTAWEVSGGRLEVVADGG